MTVATVVRADDRVIGPVAAGVRAGLVALVEVRVDPVAVAARVAMRVQVRQRALQAHPQVRVPRWVQAHRQRRATRLRSRPSSVCARCRVMARPLQEARLTSRPPQATRANKR